MHKNIKVKERLLTKKNHMESYTDLYRINFKLLKFHFLIYQDKTISCIKLH